MCSLEGAVARSRCGYGAAATATVAARVAGTVLSWRMKGERDRREREGFGSAVAVGGAVIASGCTASERSERAGRGTPEGGDDGF